MQVLFLGDSITDAGRDRSDCHIMGPGYPGFAVRALAEKLPEAQFKAAEFLNWGISGFRAVDVLNQWNAQKDGTDPDIVTLMIGINDVWRKYDNNDPTSPELYEERLCRLMESLTAEKRARVIVIEPYYVERGRLNLPYVPEGADPDNCMRSDVDEMIAAARRVARRYASALMPADGLMHQWWLNTDADLLTPDGVHPGQGGAELLGRYLAELIIKTI